jgi:hypothetical protein
MKRIRYSYVLVFCGVFLLVKLILTYIVDESKSFEAGRYLSYLMDLLNYLPIGLLVYFLFSPTPLRYERMVTAVCLVLINLTFSLIMDYSAIVFSLTQQHITTFGKTPGMFAMLLRYTLFVLSFLVLAFFFYKKNLLAESKLTLFIILAVFLTNVITVAVMLTVGHSISSDKSKPYRYIRVQQSSGD